MHIASHDGKIMGHTMVIDDAIRYIEKRVAASQAARNNPNALYKWTNTGKYMVEVITFVPKAGHAKPRPVRTWRFTGWEVQVSEKLT